MWISDKLNGAGKSAATGELGKILSASGETVSVTQTREYLDIPVAAPYGVAYRAPAGESSVVIPHSNGMICLGVTAKGKNPDAGELMLYSAGGAQIHLKNDGSVVINGHVFIKED